jgi:hypothetical protein
MVPLSRIVAGLQLLAFCPVVAQSPNWTIHGDTTGAPPGCSASTGVAAISGWFAAFSQADSAALARVTPSGRVPGFVFSTGKFTPSDTFVRIQALSELVRYARTRMKRHERITLEAVRFYGWRGRKLGFMPYFVRAADDLGRRPLAGIGKAEYWCGQGIVVLNLAPRPSFDPGPQSRGTPPNKRLKLAARVD